MKNKRKIIIAATIVLVIAAAYSARRIFSPSISADMMMPNTVISRLHEDTSVTGQYRRGSSDIVYAAAEMKMSNVSDIIARRLTAVICPPASRLISISIDNVSVSRIGYYADGTLDEMPNETPNETAGLIENGDFSDSPAVAASTLAYAWIKAEDGKWAYSVNL